MVRTKKVLATFRGLCDCMDIGNGDKQMTLQEWIIESDKQHDEHVMDYYMQLPL